MALRGGVCAVSRRTLRLWSSMNSGVSGIAPLDSRLYVFIGQTWSKAPTKNFIPKPLVHASWLFNWLCQMAFQFYPTITFPFSKCTDSHRDRHDILTIIKKTRLLESFTLPLIKKGVWISYKKNKHTQQQQIQLKDHPSCYKTLDYYDPRIEQNVFLSWYIK